MPLRQKLSLVTYSELPLGSLNLLFIAAAAVMVEELLPGRDEGFGEGGDGGRRVFG